MIPGLEQWNWSLDGWIVVAGVLSAVAAALLGNFLVLRKMSMLGDAISHAILPGLAAAFFLSGSRSSLPMFLGAVIVGILTALFTEWIRGVGKVDEGASMGVVFTSLFALGLVMIVQAADHVDLDPGCVLYGAIELTPLETWPIAGAMVPRVVVMLAWVLAINLIFVVLFFKELKLSSFDPALATVTGFHAGLMHYALMILVAVTAVASFESVGNILVVAMFVVPPAAAYMLTDRLTWMVALSVVLAALSAVLGHVGALVVPGWFGYHSTTTAGMMAVAAGGTFLLAALLGPRHGVLVKEVRQRILTWRILSEDILALLYRIEERGGETAPSRSELKSILLSGRVSTGLVLAWQRLRGHIRWEDGGVRLLDRGKQRAQGLVRSHRLWEQYLVSRAGVSAERIHDAAERLEHFTDREFRERLDQETAAPQIDPHGRPIPPEDVPSRTR
ncbi:MAG: metal ABC transporter permease [Planctomycetes bacterium]|nr:metal ABC transporter permease [Planctomycetota bacterium]